MEPYAAGWLSILPPIIAIVLALITKEVFSSLLIGIFSGAAIYTFGSGVPDPLIKILPDSSLLYSFGCACLCSEHVRRH